MNKTLFTLIIVLVSLSLSGQATAQERQNTSYTGFQYISPIGDVSDFFDAGFGLTGLSRIPMGSKMDFIFEGAWYNLNRKDITIDENLNLETGDLSVLAAQVGVLFDMGTVEFGAKGGYFFSDLHEWDVMPFAQVSFGRWSIGGEYKALGNTNWGSVYVNFRWQK